jgi:hypothetical protein
MCAGSCVGIATLEILQVNGEIAQDEIHPEWGPQPQHVDDETPQYILILGMSEPDKPREPGLWISQSVPMHPVRYMLHCDYRATDLNQLELEFAIAAAHRESQKDIAQCGTSEPLAPVAVTTT